MIAGLARSRSSLVATSSATVSLARAATSATVPMSIDGRTVAMVANVFRSARIQPMRRPPQNDFDIDPTVITRSVRELIQAATGGSQEYCRGGKGRGACQHAPILLAETISCGLRTVGRAICLPSDESRHRISGTAFQQPVRQHHPSAPAAARQQFVRRGFQRRRSNPGGS